MINTSKEAFNEGLSLVLGKNFHILHSVTLQATHIAVFACKQLCPHISNIKSSFLKLGQSGALANKGAV
jgi:hypothetical protein